MNKLLLLASSLVAFSVTAEFSNIPREPGELINKSHPELGRLTTIEVLGDYIIAIPEIPSSPTGADHNSRVLDISDPTNPKTVLNLGTSQQPILAHGTFKRGNEVYVGGFPNDAVRLEEDGSVTHTRWSGPRGRTFNTSDMYYPWGAKHWWSYGEVSGLAWLELDGERQAEWDHLALTGVVGFPTIMGNLLIYASDQTFSGMATYDISDPTNPTLLDVFNLPTEHPEITISRYIDGANVGGFPLEYGLGGYWNAPHSHYMVFARRGENPGIQIVDFEDPTDLKLHCEVLFRDPASGLSRSSTTDVSYVNFQDEFIFAERLKINVETCEVDLVLDELEGGIETSQYSRPIGNMLLTGGGSNYILRNRGEQQGGLGIWAHDAEPDHKAPTVGYHIPTDGQDSYPVFAPISVMIPETLQATTIIPGDTLIVEEVGGEQVPVDYLLSHTGMLTVDPLIDLEEGKTYRVTLQDISDAVGNLMEPYSFEFSTQRGTNNPPAFDSLTLVSESIIEPGQAVTINAFATDVDGDFIEYRFRIGEEQYSEWSNVATFSQVLEEEGNYTVTAQARDSFESVVASNVNFAVVAPTAALVKSISSGPMALNAQGDGLWVVNPDNLGIAHISVPDMELVREPRRRRKPVSIGIDQDGDRWVVYEAKDNIELVNRFGGSFHTIQFNYGANPSAIVMDTQNAVAYVALEGSGEIVKIDTESREEIARVSNVKGVHALALSGDREHLLGTRFISPQSHGEVYAVNPNTMRLERTIILEQSLTDDNINAGRGVPNYIAHIAIDGNSRFAYAVGKKDNVGRGLLNGNEDLDEDNTVRTFISVIDLDSMRELKGARVDIDNTDSPSAVTFSRNEEQLFVALQGNNLVAIFDRDTDSGTLGASVAGNFSVGLAPQGLLLNQSGDKLYVKNFTDRTVSQIDLTAFNAGNRVNPTISTTRSVRERDEMLSEQELLGKQIFYNASFGLDDTGEFTGRTSAEGYLSCASCHFDGGEDGRVYDFTGRGEGLRNNLTLNGRGGDDETLLHWSGNFDEVQDFENDIRHQFLGRGLMTDADFSSAESPLGASKAGLSEDLDALAAYVNSLKKSSVKKSQYRQADGSMTASAVAGHDVYVELNCQSCHYRFLFSDKLTHDVGTLRDHSGSRAGEVLEALRTPFLLGLFDSAPYMHDGSAETVEEIFVTVGGNVIQAEDMQLANGAQTVNANGFSYYRQAQAVTAPSGGMVSVIEESDSDRTAYIRVRYGSAPQSANLVVEVNGRQYEQSLLSQAKTEGKDVAFAEAKFVVEMSAGSNSINIWPEIASGQALIIDDITISTPQHESAADVHTRVNQLSAQQKSQLMDYLMQIDQGQNVPR